MLHSIFSGNLLDTQFTKLNLGRSPTDAVMSTLDAQRSDGIGELTWTTIDSQPASWPESELDRIQCL